MKKLAIHFIAMGIVSFGYSQNSSHNFKPSKYKGLGNIDLNHEYIQNVQGEHTPNKIKYLENQVSCLDVTKSKKFNNCNNQPFKVAFSLEDGYIVASYNNSGNVISTVERFKNFAMPKSIGIEIHQQFPNWKITKNRYSVWYSKSNPVKTVFKVQIQKGKQKKWIKINASNNFPKVLSTSTN